jgi:hypothetical protein
MSSSTPIQVNFFEIAVIVPVHDPRGPVTVVLIGSRAPGNFQTVGQSHAPSDLLFNINIYFLVSRFIKQVADCELRALSRQDVDAAPAARRWPDGTTRRNRHRSPSISTPS